MTTTVIVQTGGIPAQVLTHEHPGGTLLAEDYVKMNTSRAFYIHEGKAVTVNECKESDIPESAA